MQIDERVLAGGPTDFMTVRQLTIHGTNFQIGQALGALAAERYGKSPADFAAIPLYARMRRTYLQRHYPLHWQRMRGVAAALGIDPEDDRYDVSGIDHLVALPPPSIGCSVVYYPPGTTTTSRGYLSRNYDFSLGSMAEIMHLPVPPDVTHRLPAVMAEPYLMAWYPEDGGYPSLAFHAFDTLAGTLDGLNSAGLVVSIMADEEALAALGPNLEIHPGPLKVVGLHELQVMRLLLDTCATIAEAKEALLTSRQYYRFVPCHYIVADRAGHSFIYENSTGRNIQHVIDGTGQPQIVTNFQVHRHPTPESMPGGPLTVETNAFWRYRQLADRLANHPGHFTPEEIKAANACVNIREMLMAMGAEAAQRSIAAGVRSRTLWHSLYDQQAQTVAVSFYLGDEAQADGSWHERRSDYLTIALDSPSVTR